MRRGGAIFEELVLIFPSALFGPPRRLGLIPLLNYELIRCTESPDTLEALLDTGNAGPWQILGSARCPVFLAVWASRAKKALRFVCARVNQADIVAAALA